MIQLYLNLAFFYKEYSQIKINIFFSRQFLFWNRLVKFGKNLSYKVHLSTVQSPFQSLHFCLHTVFYNPHGQILNMHLKKPQTAVVTSIYLHMFGYILSFTLTKEKRTYGRQLRKSLAPKFLRLTSLTKG